jgi:hypothetical protein
METTDIANVEVLFVDPKYSLRHISEEDTTGHYGIPTCRTIKEHLGSRIKQVTFVNGSYRKSAAEF